MKAWLWSKKISNCQYLYDAWSSLQSVSRLYPSPPLCLTLWTFSMLSLHHFSAPPSTNPSRTITFITFIRMPVLHHHIHRHHARHIHHHHHYHHNHQHFHHHNYQATVKQSSSSSKPLLSASSILAQLNHEQHFLAPSGALIAIPTYYRPTHHHPLFQITPVLNTGLSLSGPLQLYKGYNAI